MNLITGWLSRTAAPSPVETGAGLSVEAIVRGGYLALLGREPDDAARAAAETALAGHGDVERFLTALISGGEFAGRAAAAALTRSAPARAFDDSRAFDAIIQAGPSAEAVRALYVEEPANAYLEYHETRFRELFGWLASVVAARGPELDVLEIGVTHYTTAYYRRLFPGLRMHSVDRPIETGGADAGWTSERGGLEHRNLDLNVADLDAFAEAAGWRGRFDVAICCEVIEHLERDPAEIIRGILSVLKPGGQAFITTPNALSLGNMSRLMAGENPAPGFTGFQNNVDAHHHYREYALIELIRAAEAAGGEVRLAAFSNAWEPTREMTGEAYPHRGNLVLVVAA